MPPIFQSGMILQRDEHIRLWGTDRPEQEIRAVLSGETAALTNNENSANTEEGRILLSLNCVTDKEGKWSMEIGPFNAGGPYRLMVIGSEAAVYEDVLIGDVFLLSGQSNMQLPVSRVMERYRAELKSDCFPNIRMYSVPIEYEFSGPCEEMGAGSWKKAVPGQLMEFSALGYFFAKELQEERGVPVGLIQTAIGGTPVEAWMSEETLRQFDGRYEEDIRELRDGGRMWIQRTIEEDNRNQMEWFWELRNKDAGFSDPEFFSDLSEKGGFQAARIPGYRNESRNNWLPENFDSLDMPGSIWFVKEVYLTPELAEKRCGILLGTIIDSDEVYINDIFTGKTEYRYPPRIYEVPEGALKPGVNRIAVRVTTNTGFGGFTPDKEYCLRFHPETSDPDSDPYHESDWRIDLSGEWRAKRGAAMNRPAPEMTFFQYKPSGVFNKMICPLAKIAFRAVLWYQGESNTGNPEGYGDRFASMIEDWRRLFGRGDLPFLYVQLANYWELFQNPGNCGYAEIREEQRRALSVPHTAMAVAADLGEENDLHPLNKKDLAHRLYLCAKALVYGENTPCEGPAAGQPFYEEESDSIVIPFAAYGNKLNITLCGKTENPPGSRIDESVSPFEVCGSDGLFRQAPFSAEGRNVRIWTKGIVPSGERPAGVRYAWADAPRLVIYDDNGLPAAPFCEEVSVRQTSAE